MKDHDEEEAKGVLLSPDLGPRSDTSSDRKQLGPLSPTPSVTA